MLTKKAILLCTLILGCLFTLLPASSVGAASSGITISPTSVDQQISPGANYSGEVQILNKGDSDYAYKVYVAPYNVTDEEYRPDFSPLPGAPDLASWFSFSRTSGHLKTGAYELVKYVVDVPKNTKPGSYYAVIFVETQDKPTNGVIAQKRVGTVLYIRAAGKAVEEGKIDAWSVPWLQRDPLTMTLKMTNSGTVHYRARVNTTVSDFFGGSTYKFDQHPAILPFKLRRIDIPWQNGAKFGLFRINGTVQYLGQTHTLPTQYVLVANTPMRIGMLSALLAFALTMIMFGKKVRRAEK